MEPIDFFLHSNVLMLALNAAGEIDQANPAAEKMLGRPAAELLGRPLTAVLDAFSQEKGLRMLEIARQEGQALDWELDVLPGSLEPVLVGFSIFARHSPDGAVQGYACMGRSLSEKMDFSARLAQMNQELEGALLRLEKAHADLKAAQTQLVQSEKMRALGQMVAGVAHEINNPVAYVTNNLAYMEETLPKLQSAFAQYRRLAQWAPPADQTRLDEMEQRTGLDELWLEMVDILRENRQGMQRIATIVLALRNFARLDEGERKAVDINDGIRSTIRIIQSQFRERVEIVANLGDLPLVDCYAGELNQVFLNLLMNACQAIADQGKVWVTTLLVSGVVRVSIRDNGSGMEAATLARLGEPFFTTKDVGQGTGLGLAVSFAIIEKHHGTLRFESRPGAGTMVHVEIPVGLSEK